MAQVASLYAKIGLDTTALQRGLQDARAQLTGLGQNMAAVSQGAVTASGGVSQLGAAFQQTGNAANGIAPVYDKIAATTNRLNLTMIQLADTQSKLNAETDPRKQAELRVQMDNLAHSANKYEQEIKEATTATDKYEQEIKEATTATDKLGDEVQQLGTSAKPAASGLNTLVKGLQTAGVIAAAVKFGKMAYDLGVMGAEAQRTAATFANVAGGAGAAASMLDELKAATQGTRSEVELMNNATTLMALGMGDSAAELGNIMRSVEGLGARFGGTMQTFQLMMSNDSLMRIDSFGIGVEEATERIEKFKAAGMEAGEAFDTAILELMNEKFTDLGGTMVDNTTKINQNKAAWADWKAEIGMALSDVSAEASGTGGGFVRTWTELLKLTRQAKKEFGGLAGAIAGNVEAIDVFDIINTKIDVMEQKLLDSKAAAAGLRAVDQGFRDVGASVPEASRAVQDANRQLEISRQLSEALGGTLYTSADAWRDYSRAIEEGNFQNGVEAMERTRNMIAETEERVNRLKGAMGAGITEGLQDAQADLEGLRGKAAELEGQIAELEGLSYLTSGQKEELGNLKTELGEVQSEIGGVITEAQKMAGAFVLSALEAQISADGIWTQAESDLYAHFGQQMGLFDEIAAGMISNSGKVVAGINSGAIDATEGVAILMGKTEEAVNKFTGLGTAGSGAFGEIEAKSGAARARLIEIGNAAIEAQVKIDAMHGKEIVFDIVMRERRETAAGAMTGDVMEDMWTGNIPGMASGGQFWTNGATPLIVGEGGESEFVSVIPKSDMQAGGYGMTGSAWEGDINIYGANDPDATARAVLQKLQDRGLLRAGGLR